MNDPRFSYVSGFGKSGYRTMSPRERSADTPRALYELWAQDVFDAEVIAGRRDRNGRPIIDPATRKPKPELSRRELRDGVARENDQDQRAAHADARRRRLELNPDAPDTRTPEEIRNAQLRGRVEAERLEQMTPFERELHKSNERLAAEKAAKAAADARESLSKSPANVAVRERLEKVISFAMFDETVPQSVFDELRHQRELLNRFGDAKAAAANVVILSQALLAGAQQQQAQLQAHVDRASARTQAFKAGQVGFDREPVARNDLYGNPEMVLMFGGQTVTISKDQFTGKPTAELLKTHFGVTA